MYSLTLTDDPNYQLKPHQKEGVAFILDLFNNDNYRGALLADAMGVGKTSM
jgi:SNF2 family DNA or RNA helicase